MRPDAVMRRLVGGRAIKDGAASANALGRFETEILTQPEHLAALADLPVEKTDPLSVNFMKARQMGNVG